MTKDDKELYFQLQEIFDLAWDLHINKNTQTELGGKVIRCFPSIMQQFQYACDCAEEMEKLKHQKEEGRDNNEI